MHESGRDNSLRAVRDECIHNFFYELILVLLTLIPDAETGMTSFHCFSSLFIHPIKHILRVVALSANSVQSLATDCPSYQPMLIGARILTRD
jgi:hypothetical protein